MINNRAILIAGPTASGKSEVAIAVANALGGVIINADSMQVYEGLDILTAKPGKKAQAHIPHALYSVIKPDTAFSVADWLTLAQKAASDSWELGKTPIFVGGTGLYFKALLTGLADIPDIPDDIRQSVRDRAKQEGIQSLYKSLQASDPATANRLEAGDKQRIQRAIEVFEATGRPLSQWQATGQQGFLSGSGTIKTCLDLSPADLEERIKSRFQTMVAKGALDEVKTLADRNLSSDLPIMKAIGVRPLLRHLNGEISIEDAGERTVIESRQYAKRQRTWFRNQFSDWTFIPAGDGAALDILSLAKSAFRD